MKVLMIDDCEITLESYHAFLEQELASVRVAKYPTLRLGKPGVGFDWAVYDVLLLDYDLGGQETGVDWLLEFGDRPGFPPTILITGVEDPYMVANAIKAGAEGYLNKADVTPARLAEVIQDVISESIIEKAAPAPPTETEGDPKMLARRFAHEHAKKRPNAGYRIGPLLGRGVGSAVYVARRERDGANVALKILDSSFAYDSEAAQRFIREGQLVSQLKSPNVVKIYQQGFIGSYAFMEMEYFGGGDLSQRIAKGLTAEDALDFFTDVAHGLHAIHKAGIVHRDLKPANIMFRSNDSLALADFGISKSLSSGPDLTRPGTIIGTPQYMSPEQAEGHFADERSDLYALGLVFYEMLTGSRPFRGETVSALIFQHLHAPVPRLGPILHQFQPLVDRLTAKDPKHRFQTTDQLLATLSSIRAVNARMAAAAR